MIQHRNQPALD